jgi:antitoxin component HigA of HigAB toxin-antitoxin module
MQTAEIVTVADYLQVLIEVSYLMTSEPDRGTPDGDRLEALTCLAEAFEAQRYSLGRADIEVR